ncbi:S1C family serine protease [Coraliomargarita sp. SDUM461004]|uniref:S1C family serine protease n=1 Tax=Thalassobacterium sedimentorum TaxID=3041258 RepID=A0ABU1ALG2_9BACT|nr:S1C family serine protease [Coraliomargarita sp. SDUM461004]MDQ8195529.1 S1C family serine protease [Coraliomargarita sp. SDUM461004]
MRSWFIRIGLSLTCFVAGLWGNGAEALALQGRLLEVYEQNKDAVVRVKAAYAGAEVEGKQQIALRVGTGFFISNEGHVLVSASRAAGADRVWIEYQGRPYATEAVGHDRLTNISVLRVLEPPADFSIIKLDPSEPLPATGSIAIAITCPLDFGPTPVMGLFTGIEKKLGNKVFPTSYIRTSISVDGGQGGCPILDLNGRFIGMSVASIVELDGSFSLPVAALARVRDDLMFSGHIIHGWMGFEVTSQLLDDDSTGVYLSKVIEDAPAAQAGLQAGDQLVSIAGRSIGDVFDVPDAFFFTRANQFTPVEVLREGSLLKLSVKTLPRPEKDPIIATEAQAEVQADMDAVKP